MDHLASRMLEETVKGVHIFVIAPPHVSWQRYEFAKNASAFVWNDGPPHAHDCCCFALFSNGNIQNQYELLVAISKFMTRHRIPLYASASDDTLLMINSDGSKYKVPGPGLFLNCLSQLLPPSEKHLVVPLGKGQDETLATAAIAMLRRQGFDSRNANVYFVGDRLNTDVRAALQIGGTAVHVQTGCHGVDNYGDFPMDSPHVTANDVSEVSTLLARKGAGRIHDVVRDTLVTHVIRFGEAFSAIRWLPRFRLSTFAYHHGGHRVFRITCIVSERFKSWCIEHFL